MSLGRNHVTRTLLTQYSKFIHYLTLEICLPPTLTHFLNFTSIKKGKVHPCTGTEALYRPYGP